jgi:hypothetical protein
MVHLCIARQGRNTLKYRAPKNRKAFLVDPKRVYLATSKDDAFLELNPASMRKSRTYVMPHLCGPPKVPVTWCPGSYCRPDTFCHSDKYPQCPTNKEFVLTGQISGSVRVLACKSRNSKYFVLVKVGFTKTDCPNQFHLKFGFFCKTDPLIGCSIRGSKWRGFYNEEKERSG